jgi:UDP-3-O-[3-hydroxymyristoyl] glucosamine N-acyltransferase
MPTYSLKEIAAQIGISHIIGDINVQITEPIQIDGSNRRTDVIGWSSIKKYDQLKTIQYGAVICQNIADEDQQPNCQYLIAENPRRAFRLLLEKFFAPPQPQGIAATARIHPSVFLGQNLFIGENVVIEEGCRIGDGSVIGHNTVLKSRTIIGIGVQIGSNNTIGGVGFGYERDEDGQYSLIPHIGNVVIEDGVEIGNNTCIDRGVLGSTLLRQNCKIDNLVHIAHGVEIGRNSLVIAHAQIAGSVRVGENVWIAPTASLIQKIQIGDGATIGLGAVITKDVPAGETWTSMPARKLITPT